MSFIMPLLYLLLFTGTTSILFKKNFGKCLPISFILTSLVLYLSGLIFKTFSVGIIISGLYSLIFPGYIIYNLIKKKSLNNVVKNYFSIGLYLFIILYIIIYVMNIGKYFNYWDEYGFWGYIVKNMLRTDGLYLNIGDNIASMVSHPPFISLWEMFICKLSGGYSESSVNIAIQLFEFMFFIPFASELKIKDNNFNIICKSILGIITVMLMVYALDFVGTATIAYVDTFIMLYFAYCFGTVILCKNYADKFFLFNIVIALSGFLLNKQIVLALFLVIFFYMLFKYLLDNKWRIKFDKISLYRYLKLFMFVILIPLIMYKSWSVYVLSYDTSNTTATSGIVSSIVGFVNGSNRIPGQKTIMHNYITAIVERPIYASTLINISYIGHILIVLSLLILLNHFFKKEFDDKKFISIFWSFVIAGIGYALTFLILYAFGGFSIDEGLVLASYERYAATFMLALYAIVFFILMDIIRQKKIMKFQYKKLFLLLTIIVFITPSTNMLNFLPAVFRNTTNSGIDNIFLRAGNVIRKHIKEEDASIYFVSNMYSTPIYTRYYVETIKVNQKYMVEDNFTKSKSKDVNKDFIEYLKDFEYIYVFDNYEYFNNNFSYLFPNKKVEDGKIYKVNVINKSITLEQIS